MTKLQKMIEEAFGGEPIVRKVNGQEVVMKPWALHDDDIIGVLAYGYGRKVNDTFSGFQGNEKLDAFRKLVADAESGKDEATLAVRRARGTASTVDPVTALARKTAKGDILAVAKARTGAGKIADIFAAGDAAVNKFFTETAAGVAWNDESVDAFITKQKDAGKRDYVKEADAALNMDLDL